MVHIKRADEREHIVADFLKKANYIIDNMERVGTISISEDALSIEIKVEFLYDYCYTDGEDSRKWGI